MRIMFTRALERPQRSGYLLIALACLWLATIGNVPLWQTLFHLPEVQGWQGLGLAVVMALVIGSLSASLLALCNWRWTLKPAISLMLLFAAFATHYILQYGVVVDTPMVANVLQTDVHEARDQLSWRLFATVVLLAVLPMIWLWRQPTTRLSWPRQLMGNVLLFVAGLLVTFGALQLVFQDFASLMRNQPYLRFQANPLNSIYSLIDYQMTVDNEQNQALTPVGEDARIARQASNRPPLLVFVLGETARSQNFSLNGYPRLTNPKLSQENIVSFSSVSSCGTSTAESLPCMFSHLGRALYDGRSTSFENVLDVLQHAGYGVVWIDNQSGCKGLCDRIPSLNTANLKVPELCADDECRDMVMLQQVNQALSKIPAERRARGVVVVMHQMGSHGPAYYKRTADQFKTFQPECTNNSLSACSRELITNAYDNTIVQTDFFLSQIIQWLKTQDKQHTTAMLYVSDHGESLGEKNLYLHGLPYRVAPSEQTTVPLITWLSPSFEQFRQVKTSCLQAQRHQPLSHDHLFHSVLGLMAVQTEVYQRERDLFARCEAH